VPVETSRARSVATPEIGPASLKTITRLAFQSFRDNNYEIYIADGDARNETRITNNSAADISPRLNHGADRIAFASKRDGNYEIYTVSVTGSELKRLTNIAAEDSDPFWSPDGTRILFTSNRDSNYEIYVMNADGSGQTRLTSNSSIDVDPAWSPDGSTIVFVSDRGAPANTGGRLWLMNANGSNQRQIDTTSWSGNPEFSPDGARSDSMPIQTVTTGLTWSGCHPAGAPRPPYSGEVHIGATINTWAHGARTGSICPSRRRSMRSAATSSA
jgi:Tol biopolymer transport system component